MNERPRAPQAIVTSCRRTRPGPPRKWTPAELRERHVARTQRNQAARIAAGGRKISMIVAADAADALTRLQNASGMTAVEVVSRALLLADAAQTERERREAGVQ